MKHLSCEKAGFMSLSCESTGVTDETSKRDIYVAYVWRCTTRTCIHTNRIQIGKTNDVSRYNACFLKFAIVWHSIATLVGSDLPTSKFVSDQLEHSHGNLDFFSRSERRHSSNL